MRSGLYYYFTTIFLLFSVLESFSQKPWIKVYILAGQSNMSGMSTPLVSELPESLMDTIPEVLTRVKTYSLLYDWGPLIPGLGETAENFGPELNLGHILHYYNNERIALIKYAFSSTTLAGDWRPPSSGDTTGWLYTGLMNEVTSDLKYLEQTYMVEIAGICWMQGEYDAKDIDMSNSYETNLANFIDDIRMHLQSPNLPFAIGMIDNSSSWQYNAIVRKAEINVSKSVLGVMIFDTKDLSSDGIHYNTNGQIQLGQLFANALMECSAISDSLKKDDLIIFPNPAKGQITIMQKYENTVWQTRIEITDLCGERVYENTLPNGPIAHLNISVLRRGLYFLKISYGNGESFVKKIAVE